MQGCNLREIAEIKKAIAQATENIIAPEETIRDVKLCLWELLANAIVHQNERKQAIGLFWEARAHCYTFVIVDKGSLLPKDFYSIPSTACVCDALLQEHGRGLYLVQALLDEICYNNQTGELRGTIRW